MIYQALLFYQFQFIIHYVQYSIFKYTFNNPLNYNNNNSINQINQLIAFIHHAQLSLSYDIILYNYQLN